MKNFINYTVVLTATAFLLLLHTGCKKYRPDYSQGVVVAMKDGATWEAEARGEESYYGLGYADFYFTVKNVGGEKIDGLHFKKIPLEIGEYALTSSSETDLFLDEAFPRILMVVYAPGGDAIEELYKARPEENNTITITSYDTENRIVEGEFALSLETTTPENGANPNDPRFIRFVEGEFLVRLED